MIFIKSRIKEVRKALNLTQSQFAKRIAISTSYLAGMEIGDKNINERTIRLIVSEFKVNEHWLRTGEGAMFNSDLDIKLNEFINMYKSLRPKFQDCAFNQLIALYKLDKSQ